MLDSERFRFLNIAIFTCMGFTTSLMVIAPERLDIPYFGMELRLLNSTSRQMVVIVYFFIIYAPIIMGIPRYDVYGLLMSTIYTWFWIAHMFVSDYACKYTAFEIAFHIPEYLSWLFLGVLLLYYLTKFSCSPFPQGSFLQ